jgi:hypothetical protein
VTTILHAIHNFQILLSSQKLILEQLSFLRKFANVDYNQISAIERLATMTVSPGLSLVEMNSLRQSWQDAHIVTLDSYEALMKVLTGGTATPAVEPNDAIHASVTIQGQINKYLDALTLRLPLPKRMEVYNHRLPHHHHRRRRTEEWMTLSFTCCLTGLEYSVTTKQWRTWLKVGYLLMLTNRMALDMGLGFPLDMTNEGLLNIRSIYENFKVEAFDKEFQEFFNDPFISQAEQVCVSIIIQKLAG